MQATKKINEIVIIVKDKSRGGEKASLPLFNTTVADVSSFIARSLFERSPDIAAEGMPVFTVAKPRKVKDASAIPTETPAE